MQNLSQDLKERKQNDELISGASWLAFGNLFSRILGAIYIIPWTIIIGANATIANGLFNMGYTIYALFLTIATAGLPNAISKLIAKHNFLNQQRTSLVLLGRGVKVSIYLGIISGLVMSALSPTLTAGREELLFVLWSLVPAVMIIPIISVLRGFFQGNNEMKVVAISEIVEQIARIIYILVTAVLILKKNSNDWQGVVIQSTFAAFIGATISLIYLLVAFLRRRKKYILDAKISSDRLIHLQENGFVVSLLKQSLPFVIVGAAVTLFQLVDQYTYFPIMSHFWKLTDETLMITFARFNANANKIIMIIVPIASSIAITALPMVTRTLQTGNKEQVRNQIYNVFRLFFIVMFILGFGLYGISLPIYTVFYGNSDPNLITGGQIMQVTVIFSIFFAFYSVAAIVVQSINRDDEAMKSLLYGIIVKIVFQIPAIYLFKDFGPQIASIIGFSFASFYLIRVLFNNFQVKLTDMAPQIFEMEFIGLAVGLSALIVVTFLNQYLPLTRVQQLIPLFTGVTVGGIIALILLIKSHIADDLLNKYIGFFLSKRKKE
ncbi:MAG: polysaccharide biosynthesis protein [Lactobacillaceae bacterium]|jgi:O-antigen/teichoic acid export membrane protein|nr:polysaccharide biosynthesis protein [Lactobacillaceae bacterium]